MINKLKNNYESHKLKDIKEDVRLIFGPSKIDYSVDEAIVLCLVKDGETWISDFIEHYQKMGFKHIVFLDNGSTDKTIEIVRKYNERYDNTTFLQTDIPFKNNNILLRRYLVERFAKNRWSLTVDIDELWDYPYSDRISLGRFLAYIKESGANAVVAQMLDMFAKEIPDKKINLADYKYYDISEIKKDDFNKNGRFAPNNYSNLKKIEKIFKLLFKIFKGGLVEKILVSSSFNYKKMLNSEIKIFRGGIRKKVFGLNNIWLTKMPLLFYDDSIKPIVNQHFSNNAVIADVSTILLHYKFTHDFNRRIKEAVKKGQYAGGSEEYKRYLEKYSQNPNIIFKRPTSKKLESTDQLIDEVFWVVSEEYKKLKYEK